MGNTLYKKKYHKIMLENDFADYKHYKTNHDLEENINIV